MTTSRFDPEPVCCGVCKRLAHGIGYAPKQGKPVLWLCTNVDCIALGETVFKMAPKTLSAHELMALDDAGGKAGAYLEGIGKFDLTTLSATEWMEFLRTVLNGYGESMRERLLNHKAPF
ncbi:DUF6511 domain-containing protein [Bradyrhizobium sp. SZCCHNR1004]|uniref:DUF6511 domain-containing protein n=1 Tax=Bradyrhizobium sp. SZCCHNR1004 TaxID=3057335 RepID=UPI0029170576|nr:DUF6511 domain-containing protein [Bradyrhizobium sp. SZCCHNR1004]